MKYNKIDLMKDLERLKINKKGTLLVHSSMKSIGEVEGGAATVCICETEPMTKFLNEMLRINPNLFSNNEPLSYKMDL